MNKTTTFCILIVCLLNSCAVQTICPAYHSSFILDDLEQQKAYSLFTDVDGQVVPKKPYGFKFRAEDGDSLMRKFIDGTEGKGFRVQKGRVHSQEKFGFKYDNRVKESLFARVFKAKEKPVLENPYLFDKIFKKRPYYKLDNQEMDITHFNTKFYDSIVAQTIDTARYRVLMEEYDALPPPIQAQYAPLLRGKFNVEQENYNRRYGDYFLRIKEAEEPEPIDSLSLQEMMSDTLATDTVSQKKGILGGFGLFKKKDKSKKEKKKKRKKNNSEGTREEDND